MPGFDTSNVAAEVGQGVQQTNPLQFIGQLAQTQNALNQNKMFPLQYQAAGANLGQLQRDIQAKQFGVLQSALAQTTDPSEVPDTVTRLVQSGQITADFAAQALGGGVDGLDAASIASRRRQAIMSAGNQAEVTALTGTPTPVETGGATKFESVNPFTNAVSPMGGAGATVPNTLSPSEINTPAYTKIDPATGIPEMVTKGAAAANPANPAAIQTGLPPGAAAGREAVGVASGNQYAADLAGQTENGINIAQMKEVDQLLQAPEGQTGPGTQAFNKWRDAAIAFLGPNAKLIPGLDANTLQAATQDELRKYMTRLAGVNGSPFGAGTDYRLAQAATGNANPDMSNLANRDVERMNLALSRAQQARLAAFQQTGLPPEQYSTWASNWSRQVDPRAFMLDLLSPAERQKMLAPITNKGDIAAMTRGVKAAESAGLFGRADIPGMGQ